MSDARVVQMFPAEAGYFVTRIHKLAAHDDIRALPLKVVSWATVVDFDDEPNPESYLVPVVLNVQGRIEPLMRWDDSMYQIFHTPGGYVSEHEYKEAVWPAEDWYRDGHPAAIADCRWSELGLPAWNPPPITPITTV